MFTISEEKDISKELARQYAMYAKHLPWTKSTTQGQMVKWSMSFYTLKVETSAEYIRIHSFPVSYNYQPQPSVLSFVLMPSWHVDLTLPETNIAPETLGLEDEFPSGKASWQVLC